MSLRTSRPGRAVRRARISLLRLRGGVRYFLKTEAKSDVAYRSPRMLVRGFHSDRRWLLPPGASRRTGYIADLPYAIRASSMNPLSIQNLFNDKIAFAQALEERGLAGRAPGTAGVWRGGTWRPGPAPAAHGCIVKPAGGSGGKGIRRFASVDDAVAACEPDQDYVVQELVRQHPVLDELWDGSLNTIRILAVRTASGRVALPRAVQRIGRSTTGAVDNYSSGGLVAWVDIEDGTLGRVMSKVTRPPTRRLFDVHPDTGTTLTGVRLPFWPETLQLVHDLMDAFPDAVHIGWDLAISSDGPVVIEGNARFVGVKLYQLHGPFTTDPEVHAYYKSYGLLK